MCEHVPAACFIDMEANRLMADWTLRRERVKPPRCEELYELENPNVQGAHISLLGSPDYYSLLLCRKMDAASLPVAIAVRQCVNTARDTRQDA